jgi:hypothetical protein
MTNNPALQELQTDRAGFTRRAIEFRTMCQQLCRLAASVERCLAQDAGGVSAGRFDRLAQEHARYDPDRYRRLCEGVSSLVAEVLGQRLALPQPQSVQQEQRVHQPGVSMPDPASVYAFRESCYAAYRTGRSA